MLTRVSRRILLFRQLAAYLAPAAFTVVVLLGSVWYLNGYVREKNATIGENVARQLAAALDQIMAETDLVVVSYISDLHFFKRLGSICNSPRLSYEDLQILRACQDTVDISAKIRPFIASIYCCPDTVLPSAPFMVSMDGVCSLPNHPDRDFIVAARASGADRGLVARRKNEVGPSASGASLLSRYALVRSLDGRGAEGLLVVNLDMKYIEARLEALAGGGDRLFAVVDGAGQLMFASAALRKAAAPSATALPAAARGGIGLSLGGTGYLPVASVGAGNGFSVRLLLSRDSLYATSGRLISAAVVIIALSLILGVAIIVVVARRKYDDIALFADYIDAIEDEGSLAPPPEPSARLGNMDLSVARRFSLKDYVSLRLSQRELKERKIELEVLRDQLNPHFLLNTLQALNWKIMRELKGYTGLNAMVENLTKILSYSLHPAGTLAEVEDEIRYTDSYVALQEGSRDSPVAIRWEVPEGMRRCLVPRLVFQPVIENAYKHAFAKPGEAEAPAEERRIDIRFERGLGELRIAVRDNGSGMDAATLERVRESLRGEAAEGGGIGLQNTQKRIRLLFGRRFGVHVDSAPGRGTEVVLTLPMLVED